MAFADKKDLWHEVNNAMSSPPNETHHTEASPLNQYHPHADK
mgnify:CR=1 FL=1